MSVLGRFKPASNEVIPLPALHKSGAARSSYHEILDDGSGFAPELSDSPSHAGPLRLLDRHYHPGSYSDAANEPSLPSEPVKPLGIPLSKPLVSLADVAALIISLAAFIGASVAAFDSQVAWMLGYDGNKYQLVVIGFCLSIMNICLSSVAPTFFLQCEAYFGKSILQNYEAILHNNAAASGMSWFWRFTILLLTAMSLAFSATYKVFVGGEAVNQITPSDQFGMYAPPGMLPLGWGSGLVVLFNATTPFLNASTSPELHFNINYTATLVGVDPPLPDYPKPYGYNSLLLANDTAAMLDTPPPEWILDAQQSMGPGESWNISASVLGTVSYVNNSVDAYRDRDTDDGDEFWSYYTAWGGLHLVPLFDGNEIAWITNDVLNSSSNDQSWCFMGFVPNPAYGTDTVQYNESIPRNTIMFSTERRNCTGTWTITQTGVQLVDGSCYPDNAGITASPHPQEIFTNNLLALSTVYLPVLAEILGPFQQWRNESDWRIPTMAMLVASMMWSRTASTQGPGGPHWYGNDTYTFNPASAVPHIIVENAGLLYNSSSTVLSSRPAMRKSGWLLFVFAVQPVMIAACMVGSALLYHVPISRGFGIVAILAGVQRHSLGVLEGASFSGRLEKPVSLQAVVRTLGSGEGKVEYCVGEVQDSMRQKTRRRWRYR